MDVMDLGEGEQPSWNPIILNVVGNATNANIEDSSICKSTNIAENPTAMTSTSISTELSSQQEKLSNTLLSNNRKRVFSDLTRVRTEFASILSGERLAADKAIINVVTSNSNSNALTSNIATSSNQTESSLDMLTPTVLQSSKPKPMVATNSSVVYIMPKDQRPTTSTIRKNLSCSILNRKTIEVNAPLFSKSKPVKIVVKSNANTIAGSNIQGLPLPMDSKDIPNYCGAFAKNLIGKLFSNVNTSLGMTSEEFLASNVLDPKKTFRNDPEKKHVCCACGENFWLKEFLDHHMNRTVFTLAIACCACKKTMTFFNKCKLTQHYIQHFPYGKSLMGWIKLSTTDSVLKPYIRPNEQALDLSFLSMISCDICSHHFPTYKELGEHFKRKPYLLKPHSCVVCSLELGNMCALKAHNSIHKTGAKEVTCPECGKSIDISHGLKHLFDHLDSCHHFNNCYASFCECGRKFLSSEAFKNHLLKSHTKKLLRCHHCGCCCTSLEIVKKHYREVHRLSGPATPPVQVVCCILCKKGFDSAFRLKTHIENHAESPFDRKRELICFLCTYSFSTAGELDAHIEKHHLHKPKRCTVCFGLFSSRQNLVQHIMSKSCSPNKLPTKLHQCLDADNSNEDIVTLDHYKDLFTTSQPQNTSSFHSQPSSIASHPKTTTAVTAPVPKSCAATSLLTKTSTQVVHRPNTSIIAASRPQTSFNGTHQSNGISVLATSTRSQTFGKVQDAQNGASSNNFNRVSDRKKFQCHSCKICIVGSHFYAKHTKLHSSTAISRPLQQTHCGICKKTISDDLIQTHMLDHQKKGIIVCVLCHSRDFTSMREALQHEKNLCFYDEIEDDGESFIKNRSENNEEMSINVSGSEGEENESTEETQHEALAPPQQEEPSVFPCLICGLAFVSKHEKEDHASRVHDGTRTLYICLICKKRGIEKCFSKKNILVRHIGRKHRFVNEAEIDKLIHVEEQNVTSGRVVPMETSVQNEAANPPKRLRLATEGDFMCGKCGFSCENSKTFECHIIKHNPNKEPQCPECGLCFTVLAALKKHLFVVHKIKATEAYLEEKGITEPEIEEITEEPDYNSVNKNDDVIRRPVRSQNSRPLDKAKAVVDANGSFQCSVCKHTATSEIALKTHMRSHGMAFIRSKRLE